MSSESWHPPGCALTSIQGPRAGGATQRLVGRFARLQSKSPRVHARITQLTGFPLVSSPAQMRGGKNERETSCAPRCSSGDPLPRYPCPPPALSCSLRGRPGVSRAAGCGLRRAPRELLPGRAQVGLRQALALANWASQKRTLLGAHLGNPVLRLSRVYVRPQL